MKTIGFFCFHDFVWGNLGEKTAGSQNGYCGVLNPPVRSRVWQQDVEMKFTWIYKPDSLHEQFKGNIGKPIEYLDI